MKAALIHSHGHSDQIKIEDVASPALKAGEVCVQIHSIGVNPVDWKIREGWRGASVHFPMTLGQDFAGEIIEINGDSGDFKVGDKVFGFASGAYAERAAVKTSDIALIPEDVIYDQAASLPTAGLTAYQLVVDEAKIQKGQTILIHGASGGVGSIAVQIAKSMGARVFANASAKDEKFLKELGAERVFDHETQRFEEFIRDVDAVIDLVGGETLDRSYAVVKNNGLVISTVGSPQSPGRGLRAKHFMMQRNAEELALLAQLISSGSLRVRIAKTLALSDAKEAQDLSEKGRVEGKIILHA